MFARLAKATTSAEIYVQQAFEELFPTLLSQFPALRKCRTNFKTRQTETIFENFLDGDTYKPCVVSGCPDIFLLLSEAGVLTWTLKNQDIRLELRDDGISSGDLMSGCAQLAVYMKADMDNFFDQHNVFPDRLAGVLSNGKHWCLLICQTVPSHPISVRWIHSEPTTFLNNVETKNRIMELVFFSLKTTLEVVTLVNRESIIFNLGGLSMRDHSDGRGGHCGGGGGRGGNDDKHGSAGGGGGGGTRTTRSTKKKQTQQHTSDSKTKHSSLGRVGDENMPENVVFQSMSMSSLKPLKQLSLTQKTITSLSSFQSCAVGIESALKQFPVLADAIKVTNNEVLFVTTEELFEDEIIEV